MNSVIIKILLLIIIACTGYAVSIFIAPDIASSIDKALGIPGLSERIKSGKISLDGALTDIPNVQEFKSGALDIKTKISDGIDTTKDTIDKVRSGAQKVENTYNGAKDTYDEVKQTLSGAAQTMGEIKNAADSVSESFSGMTEK